MASFRTYLAWLSLPFLLMAPLLVGGCQEDLCTAQPPAFQLSIVPGPGIDVSRLLILAVVVDAGAFFRQKSFDLQGRLDDGQTSFVVQLGEQGREGFSVEVLLLASGSQKQPVLAWAKQTFQGSGDACNFFSMTLTDGAPSDLDGDGLAAPQDCDDFDPCRSPSLKEESNFCQTKAGAFPALPEACKAKMARQGKALSPPYCGDGIDQDCSGADMVCITDDDCDGHSPPQDCDDKDASINPGAKEVCDGKDNNCNKTVDEGCLPCDVDGDGYAAKGATGAQCSKLPRTDPDDFDAGIHPQTTKDTEGQEGQQAKAALREFCSYNSSKNSAATLKVRHRDVDHDGDGLSAAKDGCPSEVCDKDGDGFAGVNCGPPKSKLDCNDQDAHSFPGAPDRCGDGVAQNCVSDRQCGDITDQDGDKYSSADDCNDQDRDVKPWATEKCDRVDNDCDGLTDEGNPDHLGNLIAAIRKLCNDDNDGECAPACNLGAPNCSAKGRQLSGVCACSPNTPTSNKDSSDRVTCAGEGLVASTSAPRCFGALQPQKERCDAKDWDCNEKADDPQGANLLDKGKPCSVDAPNSSIDPQKSCVAGKVEGCDLSQTVAHAALAAKVLAAQGLAFNPHWVCSKETRWPIPEVCNSKDDDCDGQLPVAEQDLDSDHYIACSISSGDDCPKGTSRGSLSAKMSGCGDCDDKAPAVKPGAKELCNNLDDNCAKGTQDDGADVCPPKTCCSTQKACLDLQQDKKNCGTCGKVCDPSVSDTCKSGTCVCGNTGGPCVDTDCSGGKCLCRQGGNCKGCCDGDKCVGPGAQSASKCGVGATSCVSCGDGKECTMDSCSSGVCKYTNKAPGSGCSSGAGKCVGSLCCMGCIKSSGCYAGTTTSECGSGGAACAKCSTSNTCKSANCATGTCKISNKKNGTGCSDGKFCTVNDTCSDGACGGTTRSCVSDQCNSGSCNENTDKCELTPKSGNPKCTVGGLSGLCLKGSCCTGCIDGSYCRSGNTKSNCGTKGAACKTCYNQECKTADCSTKACKYTNKTDGIGCTSGGSSGKCHNGSCCLGCTAGSSCYGGTDVNACGSGGVACDDCITGKVCSVGQCSSGHCTTTNAPDHTPCPQGECVSGKCQPYIP